MLFPVIIWIKRDPTKTKWTVLDFDHSLDPPEQ